MDGMPRKLPLYVTLETNRHGNKVCYFRRDKSAPRVRLPMPGEDGFEEAYTAAMAGQAVRRPRKAGHGSLAWLIEQYRGSMKWAELSALTRKGREAIYRQIIAEHGDKPASAITRAGMIKSRDKRAATPAQARNFLDAMRGLFRWAHSAGHVKEDPTAGVENPKRPKGGGFKPWTEEDIARYRARWPLGTRQRVWFEVLLGTGLRRGDAVRIGRQHVRDGIATLPTEKTGETVYLPIGEDLAEALAAGPTGDLAWICGASGRPLTKWTFGNKFREACNEAGVLGKSAHGIRKADATRHAEAGATVAELEGRFGWHGGGMASLYTKSANRKRLALAAAERLANNQSPHLSRGAADSAEKAIKSKAKKGDGTVG